MLSRLRRADWNRAVELDLSATHQLDLWVRDRTIVPVPEVLDRCQPEHTRVVYDGEAPLVDLTVAGERAEDTLAGARPELRLNDASYAVDSKDDDDIRRDEEHSDLHNSHHGSPRRVPPNGSALSCAAGAGGQRWGT